jgi:hypothetical protein
VVVEKKELHGPDGMALVVLSISRVVGIFPVGGGQEGDSEESSLV